MEEQPTPTDSPAPDTSNFLDWVEIKNFKSIKDLRLDCKRVNIFIGKPNVGKSNILEALGLLGASLFEDRFMGKGVRYEKLRHLYYQNDISETIRLSSNKGFGYLGIDTDNKGKYHYILGDSKDKVEKEYKDDDFFSILDNQLIFIQMNVDGRVDKDHSTSGIYKIKRAALAKKYDYQNITNFESTLFDFLLPNGINLFEILLRRSDLLNEFGKIFLEQGLELVLDLENFSFEIQRKDGFYISKFPYLSVADTFRRFIFYIAAIESNKNSVLVFEEPEVHSFPPYTQELAYRMIYDNDNQYFISTHSPYMLHPFIEKLRYDDINVFITYYEDYQSKVRALSYEEFRDILDYSTNVFFNLDHFTPNAKSNTVAS